MSTTAIHDIRKAEGGDDPDIADAMEGFDDVDLLLPVVASSAPSSPVSGTIWFNSTTQKVSIYDGSAWQPFGPQGKVVGASSTGPSTQQDYSSTGTVTSFTVAVVAGRSYIFYGSIIGGVITAAGTPTAHMLIAGTDVYRPLSAVQFATSATAEGSGPVLYEPSSSGNVTFSLTAQCTTGSALRVGPNNGSIWLVDNGLA